MCRDKNPKIVVNPIKYLRKIVDGNYRIMRDFLQHKLPGYLSIVVFGSLVTAGVFDYNPIADALAPGPPETEVVSPISEVIVRPGRWSLYSKATYDAAKANGHLVMLVFTADWCKYCKEDKPLLKDARLLEEMRKHEVVGMIVDLTAYQKDMDAVAKEHGIRSLPSYVAVLPNGKIVKHSGAIRRSLKRFMDRVEDAL